MAASTDIHRGSVLAERYRVGGRIGSGGMATVFKADDVVLDREVAVKRIHSDGSESDAKRLRREAKLGASLTHPNLVMVYDSITADDGVFIVMEHVDGRPLSELIGEKGMPAEEVLPVLGAIADALDYAHRNGIVHRDVKPANVLIGDDGIVKLVDLGAAIGGDVTRITRTHEVVGTLSYLPPERLSGDSPGGPEGDVYSLGVLAFVALTGDRPWGSASPAEHLSRTAAGPPDLRAEWPEIPPGVERALERALDPDPARRQPTAGELVGEIDAGLLPPSEPTRPILIPATEPLATRAASEPKARTQWSRRAAAATLGACALAVAGVVFAATRGGDGSALPTTPASSATHHAQSRQAKHPSKTDSAGAASASAQPASTPAATPPSASTAAAPPPAAGADLNDQGYALIGQGRYVEAIPVLRRAVGELKGDPSSLSYAYALFNLGHALRLAGQPEAAIPILEQRLQIPNQTSTVQAELDAARAAAGEAKAPKEPKPPKESPPHGRALGHDKHGGVTPGEGGGGD
jgi:serine/threonine protein kinase